MTADSNFGQLTIVKQNITFYQPSDTESMVRYINSNLSTVVRVSAEVQELYKLESYSGHHISNCQTI